MAPAATTTAATPAPAPAAPAAAKPAANTIKKYPKYVPIVSFSSLNKRKFPQSHEIETVVNPCPSGRYFLGGGGGNEKYGPLRKYNCNCARPTKIRICQELTDAIKWTIEIDVNEDKMKLYHVPLNAADDPKGLPIFKETEMQKIKGLWQKYKR